MFDRRRAVDPRFTGDLEQAAKQGSGAGRRAHAGTLVLEVDLGNFPALAALADDPVFWRARAVEENLAELALSADLAQGPDLYARLAHVQQQVGDALMLRRVGLRAR